MLANLWIYLHFCRNKCLWHKILNWCLKNDQTVFFVLKCLCYYSYLALCTFLVNPLNVTFTSCNLCIKVHSLLSVCKHSCVCNNCNNDICVVWHFVHIVITVLLYFSFSILCTCTFIDLYSFSVLLCNTFCM